MKNLTRKAALLLIIGLLVGLSETSLAQDEGTEVDTAGDTVAQESDDTDLGSEVVLEQPAEPARVVSNEADEAGEAVPATGPRVGRMPSLRGDSGLFHMITADSSPVGTFGLGLFGEFFSATDVVREGDDNTRFLGRLSLSWRAHEYVEAFVSLAGSGNVNSLVDPSLIQSQGNLVFGAKSFAEVADGLHLGGSLGLMLLNSQNDVGLDFSATSMDLRALVSYDFQGRGIPLMLHFNTGFFLDNSAQLFDFDLQRVERFAHGVSDWNQVELALGVEIPVNYVTPFLEWNLGIPVGSGDALDCEASPIPCPSVAGFASFPNILTIGIKGTPIHGLGLNLGVDIGLTSAEALGLPTTAPYNVIFGLSYILDPRPPEAVVEVEPTPVVEPVWWVLGEVVDAETGEPIGNALVEFPDSGLTSQSTDPETGRFRSYEFPRGTNINIEISHPRYQSRVFARTTPTEGDQDGIRISMDAAANSALWSGQIVDVEGSPLPATIYIEGPQTTQFEVDPLTAEFDREFEIGRYIVTVVAEGHVSVREVVELGAGASTFDASLDELPEGQFAVLRGDRIDLSGQRVAFADNGTTLEDDSAIILDQVAALLALYPDIRLRIVAHSDVSDSESLTTEQAQVVVDYLVAAGVDVSRLAPEGLGGGRPLFPNINRRNRERNRRVEFVFPQ